MLPEAPVPNGRTIRLKLRGGNTQGIGSYHASYQRHRNHAHAAAQDRKEPRPLLKRRSRQQTTVFGLAQHRKELEDTTYHLAANRHQFAIVFDERFTSAMT